MVVFVRACDKVRLGRLRIPTTAGGVQILVRRAGELQQRHQLPRLVLGREACGTTGRSSPGLPASSRCPTVSSRPSCSPERASSTTSPATRPIPATPPSSPTWSPTCASSTLSWSVASGWRLGELAGEAGIADPEGFARQ
jgi:hypothetical protein